ELFCMRELCLSFPKCFCRSADILVRSNARNLHGAENLAPSVSTHPGGIDENSPAFQRRDTGGRAPSPVGTAEIDCVNRPYRTYPSPTSNPALKRRAIIGCPSGPEIALRVHRGLL